MTGASLAVFAPAKVNLTLHVTGRRENGFHELHSLVVFGPGGDTLRLSPSDDLSLSVDGPFAEGVPTGAGNIVMRAAEALRILRSTNRGASIALGKHLPHGAGIGGGSSDAAAVVRGLSDLWQVDLPRPVELVRLGADIPVCLMAPGPATFQGVGEVVKRAPDLPPFALVLVHPGVSLSTPAVFRECALPMDHKAAPMTPMPEPDAGITPFLDWLASQRNDLTDAALSLCPAIGKALGALEAQPGCRLSRMSGSGSTCWGLFPDPGKAEAAARSISEAHPDWWVSSGTPGEPQAPTSGSLRGGLFSDP